VCALIAHDPLLSPTLIKTPEITLKDTHTHINEDMLQISTAFKANYSNSTSLSFCFNAKQLKKYINKIKVVFTVKNHFWFPKEPFRNICYNLKNLFSRIKNLLWNGKIPL